MTVLQLEDVADDTVSGERTGEGFNSAAVGGGVLCSEGLDEVILQCCDTAAGVISGGDGSNGEGTF